MKNTLISAGVAVLVVVLGFMFFAPTPSAVTQGEQGIQGAAGVDGIDGSMGERGPAGARGIAGTDGASSMNLGGQSAAVTEGDCYSFRGVQVCPTRVAVRTATTTICAIKSPAATSTLTYGTVKLTVSSTTASTVTLAKSATAFATTTSLGTWAAAANSQGTAVSLRTAAGGEDLDETFGPSQYFVVSMAGGIGTFSPTGFCQATFEVL